MTEAQVEIVGQDAPTARTEEEAPRSLAGRALDNIRTGNLGILPIVIGLAFIVVFFSLKATNFFTANNFNNIVIQLAAEVRRSEVSNTQVVELITAGRSGDIGLPAGGAAT